MSKRSRSPSPEGIRPPRSQRHIAKLDDLHKFTADLQNTVNDLLPTRGRRFDRAAILAIDFSVSDIPSVVPLREELLALLEGTYNWTVVRHTIDCALPHTKALGKAQDACSDFTRKYMSQTDATGTLLCLYFSGHGFMDQSYELNVCGSMNQKSGPRAPYCKWSLLSVFFQSRIMDSKRDQKLAIMDCCASGLASLQKSDVEVVGASAWESTAAVSAQASFTRAIIDELKAINGASITTTQLISRLYSQSSVLRGMSMPVHKRTSDIERPPALIHRIESTPSPQPGLPQVKAVARYSHVIMTVKVAKENTVPNPQQWARWLSTNLPAYIGEIDILAKWETGSALVVFVLPVEIWLSLPARDAYSFVDYHRAWNASEARRRHANLVAPPQQPGQPMGRQLQEQMRPGTGTSPQPSGSGSQQTMPLVLRSGNVPRPDDEPKAP